MPADCSVLCTPTILASSYYKKKLTDSSLKLSMSLIISSNTGCLHHYVDNTV